MEKPLKTPKTKQDYEKLGKAVDAMLNSDYLKRREAFKNRFLMGIVGGIGGVIGATIALALLLWLLSLFDTLPFVENIRQAIEHTKT